MYHAASVPHLGQPTAEQSEYVYQPAPRQYSTYSTPVQHGYGPVYGYATTPTHFQQPATAYVPAVSAAHIYPIGGDYPMQLYAQTPAGLVPVYTQQPAYTLPATAPVPPPTPTQNFYHGEDQSGHNALAPVHRPTARTPPQQTSRNNISGPKQVGSPMCTSTPVRGAPPTPSSVRRASLSSQTPSAICFRKTGARVDVTKDNLISCIYPSDEELPISGRKKPQPVSLRRRDNTASSSELTMSRQAHNLSSPSFMVVQRGQWRGGHEWEDRGQSLKRDEDWEQRRAAGQQVRGRIGHESRLQSNPFKQPVLVQNLKYKTKMCRNEETNGFCPYGVRCIFLHRAELEDINRTKKKDMSGNGSKGSNSRHGDSGVGASTDEKVARGRGQWLADVDGGQSSADGCLSRSTLHRFSSVQHLPRAIN